MTTPLFNSADDSRFMAIAIEQARAAQKLGEVPVGAIVVHQGLVIATGHNNPVGHNDPTAHAEVVALRAAAAAMQNYRLEECELYVTLEPCAMCAGAMLHARLKSVVFGAKDPKTGAMGSVVDLPASPQLNHHTAVRSGILADECGALLTDFFRERREQSRNPHPLRDDAMRTPDSAFESLLGYDFAPNYLSDIPALGGLRLHFINEGELPENHSGQMVFLCLHSESSWSYAYREIIANVVAKGHRAVAPDFIGFGRSDKPKKETAHSLLWHRDVLLGLIERLDLENIVLVGNGWGEDIGVMLLEAAPTKFAGVLKIDALLSSESGGHDLAPFPDKGHQAGPRAASKLLASDEHASIKLSAHAFLNDRFTGRMLDDKDVPSLDAAIDFFLS